MSNRAVLGVVVIVMLLSPFSKPVRGERTICLEPGEDARRRQAVLFPFDARSMSYRHGLELSLVQGSKQGVVIRPGPAGSPDSARVDYYGAVVHRDGKFQMWYRGSAREDPNYFYICYATSDDGVKWEKPRLGLVEFNGSRDNNIVDAGIANPVGIVVIYEPDEPDPGRRYKMFCEARPRGYGYVSYSGDGLRWKPSANNPVLKCLVEPSGLIKHDGIYYVTAQGENGSFRRRVLISFASADFEHWADAVALGFRRDAFPPRPYITGNSVGPQVHIGAGLWDRGNVIIGLYGQWNGPAWENDDRRLMRMNLGLVVSDDALHYTEPIPDFRMVDAYEEDWGYTDPDGAPPCLSQGQGMYNVGDRTLTWYGIWGFRNHAIRLVSWQRDRLGYFQPRQNPLEGQTWLDPDRPDVVLPRCISCPIELKQGSARVYINADGLSEHAQLRVELLDKAFRPIPGFAGDACVPVNKSGLRQAVRWRGGEQIGPFAAAVRVRVAFEGLRLEDCRLYAVYVEAQGQ